jgi:ribosomal protein S18 acetylase RimI-like enzyme
LTDRDRGVDTTCLKIIVISWCFWSIEQERKMTGRVIQGFFVGGASRMPMLIGQAKAMARPPGPPAAALAGRSVVAQAGGQGDSFQVDPGRLGLASGGGRPLPDSVRTKMEAALAADFSAVRVHVGPQAERIGAVAFTMGTEIYFAPGRFQPDTVQGQQLIGHELVHVVQQRAGRVRTPMGGGVAVVQDRLLEAEADRLGQRAAAYRVVAQAKALPGAKALPNAAQGSAAVRISAASDAGPGRYRLVAGSSGRPVGSVTVHARDKTSIEITDLGVDRAHREQGIGKMLLASAARTGQHIGKSKMTLAARDDGSGRLTAWYKEIGFSQVGVTQRGFPRFEAPISRLLSGATQRREMRGVGVGTVRLPPGPAIQRMEEDEGRKKRRRSGKGKEKKADKSPDAKRGRWDDGGSDLSEGESKGGLDPLDQELLSLIQVYMSKETRAFTATAAGRVTAFTLAPSHSFAGEQERQGMKHLSATLLGMVKAEESSDHEIQIMSIGKVHVVTANESASLDNLQYRLERKNKEALIKMLKKYFYALTSKYAREEDSTPEDFIKEIREKGSFDKVRFCLKLIASLRSTDTRPSAGIVRDIGRLTGDTTLRRVITRAHNPVSLRLTDFDEMQIILLDPIPGIHAEQNFMAVLENCEPPADPILIYGSKRPCYMCFACLSFVREQTKYKLIFDEHPGQFWTTACESFARICGPIGRKLGLGNKEIGKWFIKFQKRYPNMYFSARWNPLMNGRDDEWGKPKIANKKGKKVALSGNRGGNYQSDSESDFDDDDATELFSHGRPPVPKKDGEKKEKEG